MKYFIFIQLLCLINSFNLPFDNNIYIPRRDLLTNILYSGTNINFFNNIKDNIKENIDEKIENKNKNIKRVDKYAHWSIYGIVPPPIEKTITYNDLVYSIKNKTVSYIEIAIQHDCIVATTVENHRWACLMLDSEIPKLIEDTKDEKGNEQIIILPADPTKQKIRNVAQIIFYTYVARFISLDIPYNYKLIKEINKMNMTLKEKMYYLSNKTTNLNIVDLINDTFIK